MGETMKITRQQLNKLINEMFRPGGMDQWQPAPHDRLVRMKGKSYASGYREGLNTFSPKGW